MRPAEPPEREPEGADLVGDLLGNRPAVGFVVAPTSFGSHPLAADEVAEAVVEDGEQPRSQVRPRDEARLPLQRKRDRVLDQIVNELGVTTGEAAREGPQLGQQYHDLAAERVHGPIPSVLARPISVLRDPPP